MKYYYTDGLKAAWMCKHFKMNFTCNHPSLLNKFYSPSTLAVYGAKKLSKSEPVRRFYIAADCYGMLEPQVDDLYKYITPFGSHKVTYVYDIYDLNCDKGKVVNEDYHTGVIPTEIIQRNSKAFFMPTIGE